MIAKRRSDPNQMNFLHADLLDQLNPRHPLLKLAGNIPWDCWVRDPYQQCFCGETDFQWEASCDPSEMTCFRNRIGAAGFEKILAASIALHGESAIEEEMCVDTTVQEKNITFPRCQAISQNPWAPAQAGAGGRDQVSAYP